MHSQLYGKEPPAINLNSTLTVCAPSLRAALLPASPMLTAGARSGIMLAAQTPATIMPFTSNPRPASAPQYERLVLISSRVDQPLRVRDNNSTCTALVYIIQHLCTVQCMLTIYKGVSLHVGPYSNLFLRLSSKVVER